VTRIARSLPPSVAALAAIVLLLGLPAAASAATPDAITVDVQSTGASTAEVDGLVDPADDATTTYAVQWDLASSQWCASDGASGTPANTTTPVDLDQSDDNYHDVSVDLSGLSEGTAYCAQLIASNGSGEQGGGQLEWTQGAPNVLTLDAFSTSGTEATVDGLVDPVGDGSTTYAVEYGAENSTWCQSNGASGTPANTTGAVDLDQSDDSYYYVSVDLTTGLTAGTDYCAQLIATNGDGKGDGGQIEWTQGAPAVDTNSATASSSTTATVSGDLDPEGAATTYWVEYGRTGTAWCQSDGLSGSPEYQTSATSLGGVPDDNFHDVQVGLTGLLPSTDYCGELVANNTYGTGYSFPVTWTQPAAPYYTLTVEMEGPGSGSATSSPSGIDCGLGHSACSARFAPGTQVILAVTPAQGSELLATPITGCITTTPGAPATCTYTLEGDLTIGLEFWTVPESTISVRLAGDGVGTVTSSPAGIDCGSTCSGAFPDNNPMTLNAAPAAGSKFAGWSGGGCSGTSPCVTVVSTDATVTARFNEATQLPKKTRCKVPKVIGHKLAAARRTITRAHCKVGKVKHAYSKVKKGRVSGEKPKPGTHHAAGAKVNLTVSKGRKPKKK